MSRNKKLRRREKQFLKSGKKPRHKLQAGRTGMVHCKKTPKKGPSLDPVKAYIFKSGEFFLV